MYFPILSLSFPSLHFYLFFPPPSLLAFPSFPPSFSPPSLLAFPLLPSQLFLSFLPSFSPPSLLAFSLLPQYFSINSVSFPPATSLVYSLPFLSQVSSPSLPKCHPLPFQSVIPFLSQVSTFPISLLYPSSTRAINLFLFSLIPSITCIFPLTCLPSFTLPSCNLFFLSLFLPSFPSSLVLLSLSHGIFLSSVSTLPQPVPFLPLPSLPPPSPSHSLLESNE